MGGKTMEIVKIAYWKIYIIYVTFPIVANWTSAPVISVNGNLTL
jgi:hypothetical protein